jgi:4-hydroxy-4-methyl-2-oxoglutarate aldolase
MSESLSTAALEQLRDFDSCAVSNAIETFGVRLRNEGFTDGTIHCAFEDMPAVVGYAVTARIRCSTPPPVGHTYADRTDWWNYILTLPAPRIVVVQDVDDKPGLGAFVGEVHAQILRALGCVAYVTNGAVRDLPAVRQAGLQSFFSRTTPSHAFVHIVDFGGPVRIAGLPMSSGDLLFGDRHGLVTIPPGVGARIPRVVAEMRERERRVIELCRSQDFSVDKLRSFVEGWE